MDTAINQSSGPKFFSNFPRINILAATIKVVRPVKAHKTPRILGPRLSSSVTVILGHNKTKNNCQWKRFRPCRHLK